jgi:predicted hydrolase (HD superfamily)
MRHFAKAHGEDERYWAQVGLLHDLDYEQHPDRHCEVTPQLLRDAGYDEAFIRAVVSHGWGMTGIDVKPELYMEQVLYATDELAGLITAAVYMRPDRSVLSIEPKSVKKKFKSKGFAAGVDRDIIRRGAEMLGMELDELFAETIAGLRTAAEELGLAGEARGVGEVGEAGETGAGGTQTSKAGEDVQTNTTATSASTGGDAVLLQEVDA